jgi:hypothetical protein
MIKPEGDTAMSEQEIQTDFVEDQSDDQTIQSDESLTAGDSEQPHEEKVEFSEAQQKVVNDIASKKAFEVRESKRANEDLQRQLSELQAKVPVEQAPNVPNLPDPYSDNFEQEMQARDQALLAKAKFDAQAQYQHQQTQVQTQERQRQESEALNQSVEDYSGRAQKLGVSSEELQAAGNIVYQYGIDDSVTRHILTDDHGPLITKYLSQNPQAMDTLRSMPPISAGAFLETQIKPMAIKLKPNTTNAPSPVDTLNGAGSPRKQRGAPGSYE